jgi:hypothetical protein
MRPEMAEVNCITGEVVFREMNDEEYAQYLIDVEEVTPTPALEAPVE